MNVSGRLTERVAVVTGGASGIGKASVMRFLEQGASVVAADLNEANGESLMAEASDAGYGPKCRFLPTDVAVERDVERMIEVAHESFGRLDIVFNNAAVGGAFGPVTHIEAEDWDYTFGVLARGVFFGIKHGAAAMKAAGTGGSIINTASIGGISGGAGPVAYSSAKAAVINMTMTTAVELAPDRIRVNVICPGVILTPFAAGRMDMDTAAARYSKMQPWPDHGTADDVAYTALFLASDESRFITGQNFVVDGGLTARGPDLVGQQRDHHSTVDLVGVNRGTTGQKATVRFRVSELPPQG